MQTTFTYFWNINWSRVRLNNASTCIIQQQKRRIYWKKNVVDNGVSALRKHVNWNSSFLNCYCASAENSAVVVYTTERMSKRTKRYSCSLWASLLTLEYHSFLLSDKLRKLKKLTKLNKMQKTKKWHQQWTREPIHKGIHNPMIKPNKQFRRNEFCREYDPE